MILHKNLLLLGVTFALTLATSTLGAPAKRQGGSIINDAPSIIPGIWQELGAALSSDTYEFTMSLTSADVPGLEDRMNQIASSGGQWLSEDELSQYAKPSEETTNTVKSFLSSQGIADDAITFSKFGDQVSVKSTIAQTAKMFAAEFTNYQLNGLQTARTKSYTIPSEISNAVEDIFPLATFGQVRQLTSVVEWDQDLSNTTLADRAFEEVVDIERRATPSSCNTSAVTPQCLKDYYGTSDYTRSSSSGSPPDVGVMGYIDQYVSQSDLKNFLTQYSSSASSYSIPITLRNGAVNVELKPGVEAMLDVETVVSQIYPLKANFIAEGNSLTQGDIFLLTFNDLINNFSSSTRPKIITISYGSDENQFTAAQANSMCSAAQKLTALGTTIVVSSGDYGVGGQEGDSCPPFVPTYPSGCPYILSVGATQSFSPEVMVDDSLAGFFSGAGASNIFPIPSYQSSQVAAYDAAIGSEGGAYNKTGRHFPDIAAQGSKFRIISGGRSATVGGTSASAPLTASILALVNDERSKNGKGTIGWAQPSLYGTQQHDITSGGSYSCGSSGQGFAARSGWDGSAGQGSPYFSSISQAFGV